ncbi:AlpA family transcriptional regulator [Massilia sp. Root351]|uniref:helix-turn-helix transcriptional regulator n=1 Tax=Massilia sp. Root351 TaxID=1736522 RepID=UPI0022770F4F|nr:AlpA family phage regulatory protein [Massilia sp. Root351]
MLKIQHVMAICGKSRSAIYKEIRKGLFPRQLKLASRSAGWSRNEIEQWLEERKKERDQAPTQPYSIGRGSALSARQSAPRPTPVRDSRPGRGMDERG